MNSNALRRTGANLLRTSKQRTLWRGHTHTVKSRTATAPILHSTTNNVRGFSTTRLILKNDAVTTINTASTSIDTIPVAKCETTTNPNWVARRGLGDDIVTVVVGDKEFKTLKSTLQESPIIWDAIQSAEEQSSSTIFLDRDPKHFPMILQYLRNKVEDVSYNRECKNYCNPEGTHKTKKSFFRHDKKMHTKYVRLPPDADVSYLQDLYLEATYYELEDLKIQLDHATFVVRAFQFINGGPSGINPFERTKEVVTATRNAFLTAAGVGTGAYACLAEPTAHFTTLAQSLLGS